MIYAPKHTHPAATVTDACVATMDASSPAAGLKTLRTLFVMTPEHMQTGGVPQQRFLVHDGGPPKSE